jgi:hypothetical protein
MKFSIKHSLIEESLTVMTLYSLSLIRMIIWKIFRAHKKPSEAIKT